MPLNKSRSDQAFRQNVSEMIRAGHPRDQALAAAYRIKAEARAMGGRDDMWADHRRGAMHGSDGSHYRGGRVAMADGGDPTADIFNNPLNDAVVGPRDTASWPDMPPTAFPGESPYYSEGENQIVQAFADRDAARMLERASSMSPDDLQTARGRVAGLAMAASPEAQLLMGARQGLDTGDYSGMVQPAAGLAAGPLLGTAMRFAPKTTATALAALGLASSGSSTTSADESADPLAAAEKADRDAVDKWVGQEPKQTDFTTNSAYKKALNAYHQRVQDSGQKYQDITNKYLEKKQSARDNVSDDDLNAMGITRDAWHMLGTSDQNTKLLQLSASRQQQAEKDKFESSPLREQYPIVGAAPWVIGTLMGGIPWYNRWSAQGRANDFNAAAAANATAGEQAIQKALSRRSGQMTEGEALAANAAIARAKQDMALAPTRGAATPPFPGWGAWAAGLPDAVRHRIAPSLFNAEAAALPEEYDWMIGKRGIPGHPEYVDQARDRLLSMETAERMGAAAATPFTLGEIGKIIPTFRKTVPFPEETVRPFVDTYKGPISDQLARAQQRGAGNNQPPPAPPAPLMPPAPIVKVPRARNNKPGGNPGAGPTPTRVSPELNDLLTNSDWPEFARGGAASPQYMTGGAVRQYAWGGSPQMPTTPPWFVRKEASQMMHSGPIMSAVPGRTDRHPLTVPSGSYVIPSSHVSYLGQDNTNAGFRLLDGMFGGHGRYSPVGAALRHASGLPRPPRMNFSEYSEGGSRGDGHPGYVDIIVAGGEYLLSPDQVRAVGDGDLRKGHAALDKWIVDTRKQHVKQLKNLPPPAKK
jgi:hypothetical protein